MTNDQSVARVTEAISEIEKATTPIIHQVIGVMQKNIDQMGSVGKDLLEVAANNVDQVAGATSRVVSSGANLAVTLLANVKATSPQKKTAG